jgi:alcohol dehydrogenase class IV
LLKPPVAMVDPELTVDLSKTLTWSTGLDAINQALESIWNKNKTTTSEKFAELALSLGIKALITLDQRPELIEEREKISACSTLAGMAISITRTSICHSISYPLTARYGVPHGFAVAFTMPTVLRIAMSHGDLPSRSLLTALEVSSLEEFYTVVSSLNMRGQVLEVVKSAVPNLSDLIDLVGEMYTKTRAGNATFDIQPEDIKQIVTDSWYWSPD